MEINGMQLTFLDIPAELTQEYNRWYDLDHMPEHIAKEDVLMGRRYVAPKHLRGLPGTVEAEEFEGHPPYLSIYSFGGPLNMMSDEARNLWTTLDHGIIRSGRYWRAGRGIGTFRAWIDDAKGRASLLVQPRAIPYVHHRGLIYALGKAPSPDRRDEAIAWWENTHLPDLLTVPGVLAGIRCRSADEDDDRILHLILCEDRPADVMHRIDDAMRYARALGRFPSHKGAYEDIAFLPYDTIVPLQYDFEF